MFALNRLSKAAKESKYNDQAVVLAKLIHTNFFLNRATDRPRMFSKGAIDICRLLVYSKRNLGSIEWLAVFRTLQPDSDNPQVLQDEVKDYEKLVELGGKHFLSDDTQDLGWTLWTSHWLAGKGQYVRDLRDQAKRQVTALRIGGCSDRPTSRRRAFREYGTRPGIGCLDDPDDKLASYRTRLINTWGQHRSSTPEELQAITEAMRVAALIPGILRSGY